MIHGINPCIAGEIFALYHAFLVSCCVDPPIYCLLDIALVVLGLQHGLPFECPIVIKVPADEILANILDCESPAITELVILATP